MRGNFLVSIWYQASQEHPEKAERGEVRTYRSLTHEPRCVLDNGVNGAHVLSRRGRVHVWGLVEEDAVDGDAGGIESPACVRSYVGQDV